MSKQEVRALTKPDPFLQRLQGLGAMVKSHQTALLASIGGLFVVGLIVVFVQSRAEKTHDVASRAFADAQKTFDKAPPPTTAAAVPPTAAEDKDKGETFKTREEWRTAAQAKFEVVIKDNPGSGAARMSHLYLAQLVMDKGEAPRAVEEYKAFLGETKSSDPLFGAATLGYAAALEDAGKVDEALAEYRKLAPMVEDKMRSPSQMKP